MTSENISFEYMSWRKLHTILVELADRIIKDGYKADMVYGVMKGGIVPARIISDLLGVSSMGFIGVKFYEQVGIRMSRPQISLPPTHPVRNKKVLVVDDVVDTGKTLQLVIEELNRYGARQIRTVSVFVKPWSIMFPDYYYKSTDKWVVFPWELVEASREHLLDKDVLGEDYQIYQYLLRKVMVKH